MRPIARTAILVGGIIAITASPAWMLLFATSSPHPLDFPFIGVGLGTTCRSEGGDCVRVIPLSVVATNALALIAAGIAIVSARIRRQNLLRLASILAVASVLPQALAYSDHVGWKMAGPWIISSLLLTGLVAAAFTLLSRQIDQMPAHD